MLAENPVALRYLLPDDIYMLNTEKATYLEKEAVVAEPPQPALAPPLNFKYSGANKQRFLIVVHYPEHDFMEESHLNALLSTLNRKGLSVDDVAIFNLAKHANPDFEALNQFFKPERLLLLGNNTLLKGLPSLNINQTQKHQSCSLLYSFSFGEMMGNRDNTKAFWEQMKNL